MTAEPAADIQQQQRTEPPDAKPSPTASPLSRLVHTCHPKLLRLPASDGCRQLLLTVGLLMYLGLGAAVFSALERREELRREQQLVQLLTRIAGELSCNDLTSNVTDQLALLLSSLPAGASVSRDSAGRNLTLSLPSRWDFQSAIFFSMTAITTIGYGNVAPSTGWGRGFCCLYATFGIPLLALFLSGVAARLKSLEARALRLQCWRSRRRLSTGIVCLIFIAVGFLLYFIVPSLVFTYTEGWGIGVGLYYCFITLSTIGFGDFIAGQKAAPFFGYKVLLSLWIYTGLIFVSGCIAAIQSLMERGADAFATEPVDEAVSGESKLVADENVPATSKSSCRADDNNVLQPMPSISSTTMVLEEVTDCEKQMEKSVKDSATQPSAVF